MAEESLGQSWTLQGEDHGTGNEPRLGVYLDLVDIFRSIRAKTLTQSEALVIILIVLVSLCNTFYFLDI